MLTVVGLLGNTLDFMVRKLTDSKIELSPDDKKRAGSSLMEYYRCVLQVETITSEAIARCQDFVGGIGIGLPYDWLQLFDAKVDRTIILFREAVRGTHSTLQMYDPVMASVIAEIIGGKWFYGAVISPRIEQWEPRFRRCMIVYTRPKVRLMNIDFDKCYTAAKEQKLSRHIYFKGRSVRKMLVTKQFSNNDRRKIQQINVQLKSHLAILSSAREKLRIFMVNNFTAEDLLHVDNHRFDHY